ncbi:MAG: TlpA disulfide reductase family protein [Methylovulum sp.]|nr:TlpA disulfide reductase family protein [Methylovulum sp.]
MNPPIHILLSAVLALGAAPAALAAEKGDTLPDCRLTAAGDNSLFKLKQFEGKVLYVDFWASWCGPCAKSFPFLNQLDHDYRERGLQIIGVNLDEQVADAESFLAKYPASFKIAADTNQQCALDFGVKAMPSSYLVDRKGHIRHIHLGFRAGEAEELKVLVEQLLAEH